MMKKVIKKLLAALLAVAMVCAMAIPAFAYNIKEDINKDHSFEAFQIFKGDVEGNKISNATWGSNITHPDDFWKTEGCSYHWRSVSVYRRYQRYRRCHCSESSCGYQQME